ncbi:MAG: energy transducer TonB [Bacteroidales bacterium]|nr:energy transducer TonB [Bacteroidales bacterium]MDE6237199.1 energy transducer TonB [Muribaculaceae bacterium]MDE6537661.1 energy transducer TonB [Muribaculaceae bacterium]MDE6866535.1 energy transducer TonB [Muribaculaceae bacterium]
MTSRLFSIILASCAALFMPMLLNSQTYRVNSGPSMAGARNYIEVYEYDFVTDKPSFPGGDGKLLYFINEKRRYPEEAYKKGIQGKVTCSFVVNRDGSISNVRVLRGVEPSLNKEAKRILKSMPDWKPGRLEGKAVPVRVVRSVTFRK